MNPDMVIPESDKDTSKISDFLILQQRSPCIKARSSGKSLLCISRLWSHRF